MGSGTVLVTGATGKLGELVARHLVAVHQVKDLLLISRRGRRAPGADALVADLVAAGAQVRLEANDLSDAGSLRALLDGVELTAVIHAAGALDDGVITGLNPQRLDTVLRAKVDAALTLHAATAGRPLSRFILFSSVAGLLGNAGQGNYAAANTWLDAFAAHRRAAGLPATSLAWGPWDSDTGMAGTLTDAERDRIRRGGILMMAPSQALARFDAALSSDTALLAPVALDVAALAALERSTGALPPIFHALVPPRRRPGPADGAGPDVGALARQLTGLSAAEQLRTLLVLVRRRVAAVLGYGRDGRDGEVEETRAFQELGFDSLMAVDLRNRLGADTGLRLSPTLIFDHPTPLALAEHLRAELAPDPASSDRAVLAELDRLEAGLAAASASGAARTRVALRLQALLAGWNAGPAGNAHAGPTGEDEGDGDLVEASDDELFSLLDDELGAS
jgi:short-subunit dehydrogenase/acyl carrier protein